MTPEVVKPSTLPVRVWNAYRVEVSKALRRKFTYLGPILVTLVVVAIGVLKMVTEKEPNSYAFIAFATPLALNVLGLLLLLMYSAGLISSEMGSGSIRVVLVRPLRRHDLVFAKILLAMSYAVVMTVCVTTAAWLMALILGPFNGVTVAEEPLYTAWQMAGSYGCGALLVLLPQFAAAAYAVMISTLTRSTGGAVGAVVGVWLLADILKYPLGVENYVFSTYIERPWRIFAGRCEGMDPSWFPDARQCVVASLVFFALFTLAAVVSLSRKDFRV